MTSYQSYEYLNPQLLGFIYRMYSAAMPALVSWLHRLFACLFFTPFAPDHLGAGPATP